MVALSKYVSGSVSIVETYEYDAFGNTTIKNASSQVLTESAYDNPYMYTARRFDPETGLYYYRARTYSPQIGRFPQTDPIGYADGMNMYAYVSNNPLNFVDPWGLMRGGKSNEVLAKYLKYSDTELYALWNRLSRGGLSASQKALKLELSGHMKALGLFKSSAVKSGKGAAKYAAKAAARNAARAAARNAARAAAKKGGNALGNRVFNAVLKGTTVSALCWVQFFCDDLCTDLNASTLNGWLPDEFIFGMDHGEIDPYALNVIYGAVGRQRLTMEDVNNIIDDVSRLRDKRGNKKGSG